MKLRKYSLEEKTKLFKQSQWGGEHQYQMYYKNGGFPEMEFISNLTNDELLRKYLEWIDSHMEAEADEKYFGGYAIHCRHEMGRRLREGLEKFEAASGTADDELFSNALPAFTKQIQNLIRESSDGFRKKHFEIIAEKQREEATTGWHTEPFNIRYSLYREHSEKIGEDFLLAFSKTIKPFCKMISNSSKVMLIKLFHTQYGDIVSNEERNIRELVASQGRDKDFQPMFLSAKSVYESSQSKYFHRLEEEILKHNLEIEMRMITNEEASPVKNEALERITQKSKDVRPKEIHTYKYKIIREGVDKLLESLRLENPETTLETAKRVYAHQTDDSYSNVNKAYHHKGKR